MNTKTMLCPCGYAEIATKPLKTLRDRTCGNGGSRYVDCCGRYLDGGKTPPTAEALMRSRYTAYSLGREDYLLATWTQDTRPASLGLENEPPRKWLGLEVKRQEQLEPDKAIVEFVARYKVDGRAHRLHEISRFARETGQWFYIDGDIVRS
jgi:SEC-C motif-containing protein